MNDPIGMHNYAPQSKGMHLGARRRGDLHPAAGRTGDDTLLAPAARRHHRLGQRPIPAVLDDLLLVADDAVLVQEASIIAGMRMLLDHAGLVVEPSAALGIAAILEDRDRFSGRHVVTIVCGSNVDADAYHRWVGAAPIHRS